jgi:hypothetical protein
MTVSDLVAALRPVTATFDLLGVSYYIGGSVASSAHGVARATLDADIVAAIEPSHIPSLVARLDGEYYLPVERLDWAVRERGSVNFIHLATMFKIDVFVSKDRDYDRAAAARARLGPVDDQPDAPLFRLASAEDTILAKLEWFRRGGETSEHQWRDVLGVLRVTASVDRAYLREWAAALQVTDLLERALAETDGP